ncbi:hypothetical protein EBB07_00800 [Paenibacillaceae bacterium]|nr:hypothetical protein EBB07_00800 [Paenibacillaceae bacterium]
MTTFKQQVEQDNLAVFINFDEFGEEKSIRGRKVLVVIDNDLINERQRLSTSGTTNTNPEGVYLSTVTFFVRQRDLGYVPVEGEQMLFGDLGERGYPYIVDKVAVNMGVIEVTIEGNQS